ncbi:MAG TPA: thioredoxin family protein [Thermoplasmata archaeon]|nr:thioredoxin family protein [Thermoplasmata archaeon]
MTTPLETVGADAFDGRRLRREGVWAVAFAADWCPFCRAFLPRFAALRARHPQLLVGDVTSEESPLWDRFGIEVVPTVIVFVDGQPHDRFDGMGGVGLTQEAVDAIAAALDRRATPHGKPVRPARGG